MTRADALRKLLALGDMPRAEIEQVMGGDRRETAAAVDSLHAAGDLTHVHNGCGQRLYRLTPAGMATAFAGGAA